MLANGRKYRSKKERPCDLCRSRKVQCKLQRDEAVCETCKKLERQCTFVRAPLRRTQHPQAKGDSRKAQPSFTRMEGPSQLIHGEEPSFNPTQTDSNACDGPSLWQWPITRETLDSEMNLFPRTPEYFTDQVYPMNGFSPTMQSREPGIDLAAQPDPVELGNQTSQAAVSSPVQSSQEPSNSAIDLMEDVPDPTSGSEWPSDYSLEARKGYSNELIGLSSESDPYLLRHYLYHQSDTYTMFRLDFRRMVQETNMLHLDSNTTPISTEAMPVQFLMTNEDICKEGVKTAESMLAGNATESDDLELLQNLIAPDLGSRLVKLYSRHVHPHLPVLLLSEIAHIQDSANSLTYPIGLRSAIYALAAPFAFLDDELSLSRGYLRVPTDDLWAIAHRSFHRANRLSHISSLQLVLLLLHMPPAHCAVADPPGGWALSCSSVAIAESLGLNLDPSNWRLPRREMLLRRRLWWLMYTQHTWQALVMGRPSHINDANWDVPPPTVADFEEDNLDRDIANAVEQNIPICLAQCQLAMIVADVLKQFYTLQAVRECASLDLSLLRAQPLRTRIETWRQTLPLLAKPACELTETEFDTGAALRLSHLTLEILIHRALLRPLSHELVPAADQCVEPISTILENSYTCTKVAIEIVSALKAKHFATFWPSYARNQLCYISTFILLNLAQSPTKDIAIRNRTLLSKWRDILRTQSQAWPVARLATIRLDAVFWKGLLASVHGTGPDSPAAHLLRAECGLS